jgi:deazaflavin-dependent oxidoreductase (nitroreductase family)
MTTRTSTTTARPAALPPGWVIRTAWVVHRAIYALSVGRLGLRRPTATQWGMLRLTTIGRHSGRQRQAILGYFEDGPNLVTMAMNGWGEAEPAWWLNLQANPDAMVELADGSRTVHGRAASAQERPRLWARWGAYDGEENLAGWAARRTRETAVVILEPRDEPAREDPHPIQSEWQSAMSTNDRPAALS